MNLQCYVVLSCLLLLPPSRFSRVRLCATPWTAAYQASLSMGFSRQEHWSGLPFPSPGDFPNRGIRHRSPTLQEDSLTSKPWGKPKNTGVDSLSLLTGDLPNSGIEPGSPALQVDSLPAELPGKPKFIIHTLYIKAIKRKIKTKFNAFYLVAGCRFLVYCTY